MRIDHHNLLNALQYYKANTSTTKTNQTAIDNLEKIDALVNFFTEFGWRYNGQMSSICETFEMNDLRVKTIIKNYLDHFDRLNIKYAVEDLFTEVFGSSSLWN